jgi:predicted nuclease of predicted toxin-antitoxin system
VKFLVDNQLPTALARWLSERGYDAVHVLDREQGQASDGEIWADAIAENRIVVTEGEDFFILATRPGDSGQLLWLRVRNCRNQALLETFAKTWPAIEQAFQSGQRIVQMR